MYSAGALGTGAGIWCSVVVLVIGLVGVVVWEEPHQPTDDVRFPTGEASRGLVRALYARHEVHCRALIHAGRPPPCCQDLFRLNAPNDARHLHKLDVPARVGSGISI